MERLSKIRVYKLAKELNISSRQVLAHCQTLGLPVKTATSSMPRESADQICRLEQQALGPRASTYGLAAESGADSGSLPAFEINPRLLESDLYFNREVSWLWFNERVLHEAFDPRTPLLEKLKFLAIFSSNLDEYFMVRVAGLKQQVAANVTRQSRDGLSPQQQLDAIRTELEPEVIRQHQHFDQNITPALQDAGILLLHYEQLDTQQIQYVSNFFKTQIFPVLTPLAVDPSHPFPYISNLSLNLAVVVKDSRSGESHFARIKMPEQLSRFVQIPPPQGQEDDYHWCGILIEQVIANFLGELFPGMAIEGSYLFRITRNADLELEEDEADDLLLAIEEELRKRRFGSVVRLEVLAGMPDSILRSLMHDLELDGQDVYQVDGMVRLNDLFTLASLNLPDLKYQPWGPQVPPRLQNLKSAKQAFLNPLSAQAGRDDYHDIFSVIRDRDLLVHHPYDSFPASVQKFIEDAAYDPSVMTIKMTLYRTSGDTAVISPIVAALIAAAENGKQVVVLVELKARFDEENNILWARQLEQVGVHVVYGLVGLKTHTKIALVVRRENAVIRRYCHIGTGNYNPKTARLYTDLGLLTCNEEIGADLTDLFNYLTGFSRQQQYRKLLVAPHNLRQQMFELIQLEIDHAQQGRAGHIILKMNSLIDSKLIAALYTASQSGVQIDVVVRGICSLKPQVEGFSDNIRVVSIIGRFLEHERIFYFDNCGHPKVFIGSADWRPRNLDRRVEAVVPVEDAESTAYIKRLLDIFLTDNRQSWELLPEGRYQQNSPRSTNEERASHIQLMQNHQYYQQPD
ncbi:MAG: polyphosphate kinase 1 [Cyanobacteria bacterium P01_F01_bin.42]